MKIGVPKEIKSQEHRIGLTPESVKTLVSDGHEVLVENNGGFEAGFDNQQYEKAGAKIADKAEDIFNDVEIIEKFEEISNTFFFQTMPSVPPTRTAMREAATLLETKTSGDWASFETQIATLISSAQTVIEKAGMKGTTLT